MGSFPVGTFDMPIFVFKDWPNYTPIRQVRRGLFSWTLPMLLIVSFRMRWISFSNILDLGKIFVAGSRFSFWALWPLSCLMGDRWLYLNWVQYRQGDPLSPALFVLFIEPFLKKLRAKMQGLGLQCGYSSHSVISFADDCTGLCMTSGTLKSISDMSTNIVWLQACDLTRPSLWCCHFGPGQRLPSLYEWNWINWVSRLWEILSEPSCLEFTMVRNSVVLTVFNTYSLICRIFDHYELVELVLLAIRC